MEDTVLTVFGDRAQVLDLVVLLDQDLDKLLSVDIFINFIVLNFVF